jgi:two-component system cell cycle sensor histidine kinase/response regulator CckA
MEEALKIELKENLREQPINGLVEMKTDQRTTRIERSEARRRQVEEALQESENRYRTIFENTGTVMAIIEEDTTISLVNSEFERVFGYATEEVEGKKSWTQFIAVDDLGKMKEYHCARRIDSSAAPRSYECRGIDSKGNVRDLFITVVMLPGTRKSIVSALDVTDQKRVEKTLEESEKRYRDLFENANDIIYTHNLTGDITSANRTALSTFGYSLEEALELNIAKLVDPEYLSLASEKIKEKIETRKPTSPYEILCRSKDGKEVWVEVSTRLIEKDGKPLGVEGIGRDISERKRLERQLLQAQKMEAIGTLAGGIAHDFNNLLTTIQGYTELAMMKTGETDPLHMNLKRVWHSAVRAADLTRQLLLFSRRQPMEFASLNINKTVSNMLMMLDRLIGENIVASIELEPEVWTVSADAGNLEQVIMNLTVNARDAMPNGGKLTMKTENVHVDRHYCDTYSYARPGNFVCLSIEDTGVGMNKEIVQHIFEPFFTTKEPGKGTGLGLSVVYGIVKEHEGWINVYSEPGQGSTFRIYLPAVSVRVEDEAKEKVSLEKIQGRGERILLVEDEKGVREFAASVLGENGYAVYEAINVQDALDIFEREKGNFQLVFTDVVLPDRSGIELVDELLSRKSGLPVLLSSGYTDDKSHWPKIRERGFQFTRKPYTLRDLLRAIRKSMEQS